jgi:hypothetical protein
MHKDRDGIEVGKEEGLRREQVGGEAKAAKGAQETISVGDRR